MVYDASLGYDPDEWEECPVKEHIVVFSFFTRLILSTAAVAFVVFFYRMVEVSNDKGKSSKKKVTAIFFQILYFANPDGLYGGAQRKKLPNSQSAEPKSLVDGYDFELFQTESRSILPLFYCHYHFQMRFVQPPFRSRSDSEHSRNISPSHPSEEWSAN
ncbi:unnamed protein product [Haemonchus placei]|uniref:Uncharacterized protein n=1 Tax=Haemonchus placei TaxID=6290 RepID=A0A0N4W985_HAEPC|nr:unnamed protein product [Haemonchus placei]